MARDAIENVRPEIDSYLQDCSTVPGWFSEVDLRMIVEVDRIQRQHGVKGDLFEIGVYCGKSAILLAWLAQDGEKLTLCDLFGSDAPVSEFNADENARWYAGFSLDQFQHHFLRFHAELPELLIHPSTEIDQESRMGSCRMVHIDGSHVHSIVKEDIAKARTMMVAGGVTIMDDIATAHNPGSAIAAWESVLEGSFHPFCLTEAKLYGTFGPSDVSWGEALYEWAQARDDVSYEWHELAGQTVLRVAPLPRHQVPEVESVPASTSGEGGVSEASPPELPGLRALFRQVRPAVQRSARVRWGRLTQRWTER